MNPRLKEVMDRLGKRPSLMRMDIDVSDCFGDAAPYQIQDGIATINISGPLSNARWSWGGTTYGDIQNQINIARQDPNVKGILLNVNSPGGETDNAFETAAMIRAAGKDKPVWACAATSAYSAAYLLAAQAAKIYVTPVSGGVGSVGVYCAHMDVSEMLKQAGVNITLISAGEGKTDGTPYAPLSKDARAEIQMEIDRLYGAFLDDVATGRGMSAGSVVALGARCYDGAKAALASGLADMPGDLAATFNDLSSELRRMQYGSLAFAGKSKAATAAKGKSMTPEEIAVKTAADIETAKVQAGKDAHDYALEVMETCALVGKPELAAGYVAAKTPMAEVRANLMKVKADAQAKTTLDSSVLLKGEKSNHDGETQGKLSQQDGATGFAKAFAALGIKTKGEKG